MDNNNQYNDILKEKKKYVEKIDDRHFLRKHALLIDILIILIILIISFIIYVIKVLNPSTMVLDDIKDFTNKIYLLYEGINIENKDGYKINGNIIFNIDSNYTNEDIEYFKELDLKYTLDSNNINITSDKYNIDYHTIDDKGYLSKDNNYLIVDNDIDIDINNYKYTINKILEYLKEEISIIEYNKKIFLYNNNPTVEVNISLTNNDLNSIYKDILTKLKEDNKCNKVLSLIDLSETIGNNNDTYNITIRNDLFQNTLTDMKIVINNNDNDRRVLIYEDNTITYTKDEVEYKILIKEEDNSLSFRVYNNELMEYIFNIEKINDKYTYTYQKINTSNKIVFKIDNNGYNLNIKKESDTKKLNIEIESNYKTTTNNSSSDLKDKDKYIETEELSNKYLKEIYNRFINIIKSVNIM